MGFFNFRENILKVSESKEYLDQIYVRVKIKGIFK